MTKHNSITKKRRRYLAFLTVIMLMVLSFAGCASDDVYTPGNEPELSYEDAVTETKTLMSKVQTKEVKNPYLDLDSGEMSEADALADISTFPITVKGTGDINLEIAGATEMTSESAPDDWLNVVAKTFNKENHEINGKTISVTVRQITSGEVVTYMMANAYQPQLFLPSAYPWASMLESSGIGMVKLSDKLVGNTAGILMKDKTYDEFIKKYKEATLDNVINASIEGDVTFAYPNPYTSTTGLNGIGGILSAFNKTDPLSNESATKLLEYQKTAPPVAYTTAVLRNQAAKGVIDTMLMEEQAYINTPELKNYKYIPFGIRHDHPLYTFDYCTSEQQEAAKLFTDYCLNDENQKLAKEKGFNHHDDYQSQDYGLSGSDWVNAQKIWKENKNGGKPIIAVFVADTSASMDGEPINNLKSSLISASSYINSEHYIGLVSYDSDVTINLPINQFDNTQRAYFAGEVKNMTTNGNTCTYDATLTAIDMLLEKSKDVPDAKLMLFLLTDGAQNKGYSLKRIAPIVEGLQIPVYTIAYNYDDSSSELKTLSDINESAALNANSDDIVNQLRNLFNTQL